MPWTIDKSKATFSTVTKSEQEKWDTFQNAIQNQGMHPKEAAELIGDSKYTKLKGTDNQYEIRLSQAGSARKCRNSRA
jgi:hypothetical protein